jgi:uncharacterized membrane protein
MNVAGRFDRLDALRTVAMVWMTVFHFSFDLNFFGLIAKQNFYTDPFWTWQRTAIVSLFLFTAGLGQAVAVHQQGLLTRSAWQRLDARFWQRWAQVAGCALLVSAGSALVFPGSFIYFGVLHGLALMLIVARLSAGWGRWLWVAGGLAVALKYIAADAIPSATGASVFNDKWLNWLGLISRKPITEDYVPLVPWLAAVWWGLAAGLWVLRHRPHWFNGSARAWQVLALPGRWSLSYYMLHQPVLMGLLWLWMWAGR